METKCQRLQMTADMHSSNPGNVQMMSCPQHVIALSSISAGPIQAATWCNCLNAEVDLPSPVGNGWTLNDDVLEIIWMTRPPAPESLVECVECKCKSGCSTMRCSCRKNELKCTDLCRCSGCQNADSNEEDRNADGEQLEDIGDEELGGSDTDLEDDDEEFV